MASTIQPRIQRKAVSSSCSSTPKRVIAAALLSTSSSSCWIHQCHGFAANTNTGCSNTNIRRQQQQQQRRSKSSSSPLYIRPPPGSGYIRIDSSTEEDPTISHPELTHEDVLAVSPPAFPSTYEPMLEYPGTMRPGRTPENMPYHDLPGLDVTDPEPVPWPHFQEIEWHHKWEPPHEQALAMEEFIELEGRWASVEEEAEMRMGMRRGVRERRQNEELGKAGVGGSGNSNEPMVIMDDEDEDEDEIENKGNNNVNANIGIGLGEGVEALLKGAAVVSDISGEEDDYDEDDDDDDDFLLDLGLGGDEEDDEAEDEKKTVKMVAGGDNDASAADVDLGVELGFDLEDDEDTEDDDAEGDEEEGDFMDDDDDSDMSLDDFANKEDGGGDDADFDDGGFDYGE